MMIPDVKRLEKLWSGEFGNAYTDRNAAAARGRQTFWQQCLTEHPVASVLEVGCNVGANLTWLAQLLPPRHVYGVDINEYALQQLRAQVPGVNAVWAPARQLPFRDGWCELVFTAGVLIHQPEATLPLVMAEIVRCASRYVLCLEYAAEETVEVAYRGHDGALFKRPYGRLYQELFPELTLLTTGALSREEGWDDVTYWLFAKSRGTGEVTA